jgi:hypothetical protein
VHYKLKAAARGERSRGTTYSTFCRRGGRRPRAVDSAPQVKGRGKGREESRYSVLDVLQARRPQTAQRQCTASYNYESKNHNHSFQLKSTLINELAPPRTTSRTGALATMSRQCPCAVIAHSSIQAILDNCNEPHRWLIRLSCKDHITGGKGLGIRT